MNETVDVMASQRKQWSGRYVCHHIVTFHFSISAHLVALYNFFFFFCFFSLTSNDLLVRSARHYEGAFQILVRKAVATARQVSWFPSNKCLFVLFVLFVRL